MLIRKIKPEEKVYAGMIQTLAFKLSEDYTEKVKEPEKNSDGYEKTWGAFDENGKMCSCMEVIPYMVSYDGHEAKMAGIGGVATLPEVRSSGNIRAIFEKSMREMYKEGVVFSYLYPFSHPFYRKFGYEFCYKSQRVTIDLSDLKKYKPHGKLSFFEKDGDLNDIKDIYKKFAIRYNLAVLRSDEQWKYLFNKDPYSTKQVTYTWLNDKNKPLSYITFSPDDDNAMNVLEFAWENTEGLFGMFSLLNGFSAQYEKMCLDLPTTVDPHLLVDEIYNIEVKHENSGMNRIVNVKEAFKLTKSPFGEGNFIIEINDCILDENNIKLKISWKNNQVTVIKSSGKADLALDIQTLTQLLTGYISSAEAEECDKIEIKSKKAEINAFFVKKGLYLVDKF